MERSSNGTVERRRGNKVEHMWTMLSPTQHPVHVYIVVGLENGGLRVEQRMTKRVCTMPWRGMLCKSNSKKDEDENRYYVGRERRRGSPPLPPKHPHKCASMDTYAALVLLYCRPMSTEYYVPNVLLSLYRRRLWSASRVPFAARLSCPDATTMYYVMQPCHAQSTCTVYHVNNTIYTLCVAATGYAWQNLTMQSTE